MTCLFSISKHHNKTCTHIDIQKTTKNQYGNTKICIYVNSAWGISIFCVNLEFFTHFLLYRVVKTQSRENLIIFSIRNTLQKFATQTQHDAFQFFASILNSFIIYYHPEYTKLWQKKMVIFSIRNTVYMNFTLGGCKIP